MATASVSVWVLVVVVVLDLLMVVASITGAAVATPEEGVVGAVTPGPEITLGSRRSPLSMTGMPSPLDRAILFLSSVMAPKPAGRCSMPVI